MLTKEQKQKILCLILLSVGVGLCIGGIWVPTLLVVGVPILSVGLGVAADIYDDKTRNNISNIYNYTAGNVPNTVPAAIVETVASVSPVKKISDKSLNILKKAVNLWQEKIKRKKDAVNYIANSEEAAGNNTETGNINKKDKLIKFTNSHFAKIKENKEKEKTNQQQLNLD